MSGAVVRGGKGVAVSNLDVIGQSQSKRRLGGAVEMSPCSGCSSEEQSRISKAKALRDMVEEAALRRED